ncbi:hypothetical protein SAMN04489724_4765 [Algoriphagus locisalis]|uniref:Tetratricopeptide repeat-containing protein n=1 Tax=Algoriphagus locisalis TaxID=305507 RepID=A0A1I7E2G3_9BACT|nr:hypothetical protein [Algoriphagus locisalis]SFU18099.1 hypothetical protein SAMN04489724_4765 [Algoriphagus locisalis]
MNREQLQKDFFPPEIILKIYQDIPDSEIEAKIKLVNEYIEKVRGTYDEDVLKIHQHNQIAFCYWIAEQYVESIKHFEIVVESLQPEDCSTKYFLALNLLIRGTRLLSKYNEAEKWAESALANHHLSDAISNLHILNDYCDVITETESFLDEKHNLLIQSIIDEYGFPEKLEDPIDTIQSMSMRHKYWSNTYSKIVLNFRESDPEEYIQEIEKYIESCDIEWFRNHALKSIEIIKERSLK